MNLEAERTALLRGILEQPADDTARLVFADWLDEHGQHERAEFIRAGCRLPHYQFRYGEGRTGESGTDERVLFDCVHTVWSDLAKSFPSEVYYRAATRWVAMTRGFVFHIEMLARDFLQHAAAFFAAHPVASVDLLGHSPIDCGGDDTPGPFVWVRASPGDLCLMRWEVPYDVWAPELDDEFNTEEEAILTLSAACVTYGRKFVGLPPLPKPSPSTVPPVNT